MATSTVILYQTSITPEKNCVVEQLSSYLAGCSSLTFNNFQYVKIEYDVTIKVNINQQYDKDFDYNYAKITNSSQAKDYYYFILGTRWISQNTIELSLSLDSLNSYWSDLHFTDKTHITRQHKDRFTKKTTNYLLRNVDRFEEGITGTKFFVNGESLRVLGADYDWYLIYKNKQDATVNTSVPIDCFCCASQQINLNLTVDNTGIQFSNYNVGDSIYVFAKDNAPFTTTIKGTSYTISASGQYKGIAFIKQANRNIAHVLEDNTSTIIVDIGNSALTDVNATLKVKVCTNFIPEPDSNSQYTYYSVLGQVEARDYTEITIGPNSAVLLSINSVNRSDTKLIKIIKMPYAPFDVNKNSAGKMNIPTGWTYSGGYLKLNNLNTEFLSYVKDSIELDELQLAYRSSDLAANKSHDIKYESKLYNSNFYSVKYAYDSFEKEVLLERFTTRTDYPGNTIKFKQSNNISSNSLFEIQPINGSYDEPTLYGRFLNVNRQQEVALYSSDYINYIRSGYNYDQKAKNRQLLTNILGTGISLAGSAAGFGVTAITGGVSAAAGVSLAQSAVSSLVSTINSAISAEDAINQKLEATKNNPASISSTEDLNLLSYYNGNRLIKYTESVSDPVKNSIYNLFRLTGYSCDDYQIPNTASRLYYNFIQCDPDIDMSYWTGSKQFIDDIKARCKAGVTVFHRVNNSYDFEQEMENFETWLITST